MSIDIILYTQIDISFAKEKVYTNNLSRYIRG